MDEIKEESEGEISTRTRRNKEKNRRLKSLGDSIRESSKKDTVCASNKNSGVLRDLSI